MIVIDTLHKSFNTKTGLVKAVDGVSFSAADGQITGLLGPNGAGKTTTLRMLYTLMSPDQGSVTVDGVDAARDPVTVRRALGVLPDARGVYKRLTARENIAYFGELHGMSRTLIAERTRLLSAALDMDDILDRQTEGFSQGQRTKTAIARAGARPAQRHPGRTHQRAGRDDHARHAWLSAAPACRGALRDFSSHIMQEVAALCDRIVIVAKGTVVACGSADELRAATGEDNLEDAFVKAIGSDEGLHA
ncbi:ATP-binding cassette domain-containing protein [Xanthomonas populi]